MGKNWKRNAFYFLAGQAISLLGSAMVQYAITWHITLETKSGFYTTVAVVCGFLPTLLLSPFAGVWADRYDRKKLIVIADGAIALSTLALALLFMAGYRQMWLLFAAMAVRSFGGAVQTPCVNALLPDIVPKDQLDRVNGINASIQSLINLTAPMLGGLILGAMGLVLVFFVDVVTAAVAIVIMLALLQVERQPIQAQEAPNYARELREGFAYIGRLPWLRNFFLFITLFFAVIGPVSMLTPLQVARNYGDDVWRLMVLEAVFSVGMMAGGLAIAAWGGFKNRVRTIGVFSVGMGVLTLALGLPVGYVPYVAIMGLLGVMMPFFNTPAITMMQEKIDPAVLGRMFAVMSMISGSVTPLSMMLYGPLADAIRIEWLLLFTGAAIAAIGALMLVNRALLREGERSAPAKADAE